MKIKLRSIFLLAVIISLSFSSCFKRAGEKMMDQLEAIEEEIGEVEEALTQLGLADGYDGVQEGLHLVLNYDAENKVFVGTVENTTVEIIKEVTVEVHLSNGVELEAVELAELPVGKAEFINLDATGQEFETWSAYVEVGSEELEGEGEDEDNDEEEEDKGEDENGKDDTLFT